MSGDFWLDWLVMAVSLFNAILLLWLGATVLLNAESHTWGIWLAGGGLLAGAAFFVSHTAILGHGLNTPTAGVDFWWRVGWAPLVVAPFAWYVLMLWYAGHWEGRPLATPAGRHRTWFLLTTLLTVGLVGLLLVANPIPTYWQAVRLRLSPAPAVGGVPLLVLVYLAYIVLSIGLSLDALRRPAPSGRLMGDLARQNARPWLMAASATLMAVSLAVAWAILWLVSDVGQRESFRLDVVMMTTLGWIDLAVSSLIAVAVVLLGQAIVAYEVFTGKTLPRRGFRRHWRNAIILAAGCSGLVSWSLAIQLRPLYGLLLMTAVVIVFFALLVRRAFAEREQTIRWLRPFVTGQRLYECLLAGAERSAHESVPAAPFRALCEQILGARAACLAPTGPLAALAGPPWRHPPGAMGPSDEVLARVMARVSAPDVLCVPVDPHDHEGMSWAVPLWGEHGPIGVLLLGSKRDGGSYTQEEMEIARAVGERLIDTRASSEMARRLMMLQRQHLAESQVLDQQARRRLHDDILPCLHTAMLALDALPKNGKAPAQSRAEPTAEPVMLLAEVHRELSDLLRSLPASGAAQVRRSGLVAALRRAVDDEMATAFDGIAWCVEPEAEQQACRLPALASEVLFYAAREALRNAARHARRATSAPLHLRVTVDGHNGLTVCVEDDGTGITSADQASASAGQGIALHGTMMAVIGGSLTIESLPGTGTRVVLTLPQEAAHIAGERGESS